MLSQGATGRTAILVILLITLSAIITTGGWLFINYKNYNSSALSYSKAQTIEFARQDLFPEPATIQGSSEILQDLFPVEVGKMAPPPVSKTISFVNPPIKELKPEPLLKDILPAEGGF